MTSSADNTGGDYPDVRPLVGTDRGNFPLWVGLVVILLFAAGLFVALEARRQRAQVPAVRPDGDALTTVSPYQPPPLTLPPVPAEPALPVQEPLQPSAPAAPVAAPRGQLSPPPAREVPPDFPSTDPITSAPPATGPKPSSAAAIVFDGGAPSTSDAGGTLPAGGAPAASAGPPGARTASVAYASRGRASRLTTVVARGTLIPAVLETALDSTQPGQARALISEDVYNLRGDRVLIPRGSRLYGEYRADLAAGQKRAFVQWNELMRPDGAVIAIESPATDPLGRAGIRGKVDSHFISRFGGALLQSAIEIGTLAAAQSLSGSSIIIATPVLQSGTSQLVGPPPKPSLTVRQGTRISVLVSRDLEFAPVEASR